MIRLRCKGFQTQFLGRRAFRLSSSSSLRIFTVRDIANNQIERIVFQDGEVLNFPQLIIDPIQDQFVNQGSFFEFQHAENAFIDLDGDALTISAGLADGAPLPVWLTYDAETRIFSGTPADVDAGQLEIHLIATDSVGLQTVDAFNLTVSDSNDAPVANVDHINLTRGLQGGYSTTISSSDEGSIAGISPVPFISELNNDEYLRIFNDGRVFGGTGKTVTLRGQLFDVLGNGLGDEFDATFNLSSGQEFGSLSITNTQDGGFFIIDLNTTQAQIFDAGLHVSIVGQKYDQFGNKQGNAIEAGGNGRIDRFKQSYSAYEVFTQPNGNIVVVSKLDTSNVTAGPTNIDRIDIKVIDPLGNGIINSSQPIYIQNTTEGQSLISAADFAMLSNGNIVVASNYQGLDENGIPASGLYVSQFDINGNVIGTPFITNPTNSGSNINNVWVSKLPSGDYTVFWEQNNASLAQRFDSNSNPIGEVITLPIDFAVDVSLNIFGIGVKRGVLSLDDGSYVISGHVETALPPEVLLSNDWQNGSVVNTFLQRFDSNFSPIGAQVTLSENLLEDPTVLTNQPVNLHSLGNNKFSAIYFDNDSGSFLSREFVANDAFVPVRINVLDNDTDTDIDTSSDQISLVSTSLQGNKGSVSIQGNDIVFDPGDDFNLLAFNEYEQVEINYTISDMFGELSSSTVTILVSDAYAGIFGTNDDDSLAGGTANDFLSGRDGDDYIYGNEGDDILDGGAGNDYFEFNNFYGPIGHDEIIPGSGADVFYLAEMGYTLFNTDLIESGNDIILNLDASSSLTFKDWINIQSLEILNFDHSLTPIDRILNPISSIQDGETIIVDADNTSSGVPITGTDKNDTFILNSINSYIDGGEGNDTYIINAFDSTGDNRVFLDGFEFGNIFINDSSGKNTIIFGSNLPIQNPSIEGYYEKIGESEYFVIDSFISSSQSGTGSSLDSLIKIKGSFDFQVGNNLMSPDDETVVISDDNSNTVDTGAGNDNIIITNRDQAISVNSGDGDDNVTIASSAFSIINLGSGNDVLNFSAHSNGQSNQNEYNGSIVLGGGSTKFVNIANDARGSLGFSSSFASSGTSGNRRLSFGGSFNGYQISYGSLLLSNGDIEIHLEDFDQDDILNGNRTFDVFEFDGQQFTYEELVALGFDVDGTAGDDVLDGGNLVDRISGFEGNDILNGKSGDDTYIIDLNNGIDTIIDSDGNDSVHFGLGIDHNSISVGQSGNDLLIQIDANNSLQISGWFDGATNQIENFVFGETSTTLTAAEIEALISAGNTSPQLDNAIVNQTTDEDAVFSFAVPVGTFSDPDAGDTLTYSATLVGGGALPSWLTFDALTQTFNGTPENGDVGNIDVEVTATDTGSLSATDTFTLAVNNTNDAPVLDNAIADQSIQEGNALNFVIPSNTFSDIDVGDSLTYSATLVGGGTLPGWLTFDALTQTFSGTPENGDVGNIDIEVTATDVGGLNITDSFALTVGNVNAAPTLDNAIVNQTTDEDAVFSFAVPVGTFSDPDAGDTLTYSATLVGGGALPSWLTFDALTQTFSGTPENGDVGNIDVEVTATDTGSLSATDTFTLTVNNTNDAPVLDNAIADQSVEEDSALSFAVPVSTFSDADVGDTLTYSATLVGGGAIPSWLTFDALTQTFSGTPTNGDVGVIDVEVTATDTEGLNISDSFALTVTSSTTITYIDLIGTNGDDYLIAPTNESYHIQGLDGDDDLDGYDQADILDGGAGYDYLYAYDGDDILIGGLDDDELYGGDGNDSYLFSQGDGNDKILESNGNDTITFGAGILDIEIEVAQGINDLVIKYGDNDTITIEDWFQSGGKVESVVFDETNTTYTATEIESLIVSHLTYTGTNDDDSISLPVNVGLHIQGLDGDDDLDGYDQADILDGGSGEDYLYAFDGDDVLIGGLDDDRLYGNKGSDEYAFNLGDGFDKIYETNIPNAGDIDSITYGAGIDESDLWFVKSNNHLDIYTLGSSGDKVRSITWYSKPNKRIEEIHAGGQVLLESEVQQLVDAMAAFGAPVNGEVNLTQAEQNQIDSVIASVWSAA